MFGLGIGEILVLSAAGVVLFGAKRLPALGHSVGQAISNFKKGLDSHETDEEIKNEELPSPENKTEKQ